MAEKKICDKCNTQASDRFATTCEYCGGTSFTISREPEKERVIKRLVEPANQVIVEDYNPSILEGLLDTSFLKYTTRSLASFTYQVALFIVGLNVVVAAIFLIWVITNADTTFSIVLGAILATAIFLLVNLIWIASLRLRLESFTALVQVAKNTQKQ
jgi:ribosomal protein L40E